MEKRGEKVILSRKDLTGYIPPDGLNVTGHVFAKLTSEMSDISFFDVFYGQFTIAVTGGHFHIGPYGMCPDLGLLFQLKFLTWVEKIVRTSRTGLRNLSGIPEPGRISQQFSFTVAFLANVCNFWLNQLIFLLFLPNSRN